MDEGLLPPERMSWKGVLGGLDEGDREKVLEVLEGAEVKTLVGDWFLEARREQMEPPGDWFIWLIMAGRGFGKNWAGSNWLVDRHRIHGAKESGIVAATSQDLRRYCIEGPSGILMCAPDDFRPTYQPSKTRLLWPNGSTTLLFTSEEPERLRGPNLDSVWCDELGAWKNPEAVLDMLYLTLRLGDAPKCMMTTTPRPIPVLRALLDREGKDVTVTRGSTRDNEENLAGGFISQIEKQFKGTRLERQEIHGEFLDFFEGSLWSPEMLEAARERSKEVELTRVLVGVDPPTTSKGVCGIVVAGIDGEQKAHVLADYSISGSPETWAGKVVSAAGAHSASAVVAEVNQGGEMVRSVIQHIDPYLPINMVRAAKGKIARAEPVAMLYEQGRVTHHGMFKGLEDEMVMMVPGELRESPNRVDALVWVIHELLIRQRVFNGGVWGRRKKWVSW